MYYKLSKLLLGTNSVENVFEIGVDMTITSMCHVNDFGFLFLFRDNHCVGYSDYKGKTVIPWMGQINERGDKEGTRPLFSYPSSLCYVPLLKKCFLIESGGTRIKSIEISSKYCAKMPLLADSL